MDLMATDTSAQSAPIGGGLERQNLPFYSRFHTNNTAGVDVFSHNVNHMPGSLQKCFGYCFPQPSLVGASQGADSQFFRVHHQRGARSAEEACER